MKWKGTSYTEIMLSWSGGEVDIFAPPPPSHHHPTGLDPFSLDVGTAMALYSRHGSELPTGTPYPMVHDPAQSGTTRWASQQQQLGWMKETTPNLWLCLIMLIDLAIVLTEHSFRLVVKYNDCWKQQLGLQ